MATPTPMIFVRSGVDSEEDQRPFSWTPEVASSMTVEDEQNEAFKRFLIKNHNALRNIGHLVAKSTKMAEPRCKFLIDWTKPEALTATDVIGSNKYTRFEAIHLHI
jgi:hypothetical protein